MMKGAELTFDVATHTYRYSGRVVPSVTQVLRPIDNFDRVDPELLERARAFGSHVHAATDLFDREDLDEEDLDANLLPYLSAYKLVLSETGFVVTHSEQRLYNARQRYAGTLDKRGTWKGTTWLLDLKSGAVPRSVGLQTSAYQQACEEKPKKRLCLQLMRNRYRLIKCEEASDWSFFVSFLNTYKFMHRETIHARSETETSAVA
jgi:hypothetical protein